MNAYELADELKKCIDDGSTDLVCVCDAANMLRQQAEKISNMEIWEKKYLDRIEELEKEVKELTFKQESLCKIIRMRLNDVPRSQHPSS